VIVASGISVDISEEPCDRPVYFCVVLVDPVGVIVDPTLDLPADFRPPPIPWPPRVAKEANVGEERAYVEVSVRCAITTRCIIQIIFAAPLCLPEVDIRRSLRYAVTALLAQRIDHVIKVFFCYGLLPPVCTITSNRID